MLIYSLFVFNLIQGQIFVMQFYRGPHLAEKRLRSETNKHFLTTCVLIYIGSKHLPSLTSWHQRPRFAAGVERCGTIWDPAGNANLCQ